eukprot:1157376-Pelagomonas_calceolata.AAC.5
MSGAPTPQRLCPQQNAIHTVQHCVCDVRCLSTRGTGGVLHGVQHARDQHRLSGQVAGLQEQVAQDIAVHPVHHARAQQGAGHKASVLTKVESCILSTTHGISTGSLVRLQDRAFSRAWVTKRWSTSCTTQETAQEQPHLWMPNHASVLQTGFNVANQAAGLRCNTASPVDT